MTKDWTGNSNSIYKTLGASNHTDKERQNEDYYATDPKAADLLLELETFAPEVLKDIQEAEQGKSIFLTKSTVLSKNLGNSSHYDINDKSMSFAIWAEEIVGKANNWYFVLPNVTNGKNLGVAIELFYGAAISWDGRVLRHCTSVTDVGLDNNVYSGFICSK